MGKWIDILCYGIAFLLISSTIFGLILYVPPVPEEPQFGAFVALSALFSVVVGGLIVALFAWKDRG